MNSKSYRLIAVVAMIAMLVVAVVPVGAAPPAPNAGQLTATPLSVAGTLEAPRGAERWSYIIRLEGEPLALYDGGIEGLPATSAKALGQAKLDVNSDASKAYMGYLADQQASFVAQMQQVAASAEVIHSYKVTLNGISAIMTPAEAAAVAALPGVVSVVADELNQPLTDVGPQFIGAVNVWNGSAAGAGEGTKGEGVIAGIIDNGIWPEHPSFADDGSFPEPPASWGGECAQPADDSAGYECTNKLIGVQFFLDTYDSVIGYDGLFFSGRDDDGHGTHTASTTAGNEDVPVTLLGVDRGTISGMAPRAHVASYKGLGPQGGFTSDLVAAIEKATADGVDVINYSIGGGASDPWGDPDGLAFLAAREAGIFVATSAGNSGPGPDTLGSPGNAPWMTTVGASTSNRHFISDITLEGPGEPPTGLYGASVTAGVENFRLVDAEGIADTGGDDTGRCLNPYPAGTFEATDVVLCQRGVVARVVRGENVQAGGGGGVILYNPVQQGLSTDSYVIPAVHVENDIGQLIKDYIVANPGEVTVSFTAGTAAYAETDDRVIADMMASFSSRGPNGPAPAIIKPDVTAPGVQTLAGASPEHVPDGSAQGELFQSIQGTSMSSPHTAGAGALLTALYPDWSPAAIQSALMTTGLTDVVKEDGSTPADPFDMGGGRIDLNRAADPGLVFDMTAQDYLDGEADQANMNLPSLGFGNIAGRATIQRTATNLLGVEATYQVSYEAPAGVTISVSPDPVVVPANGTATFEVTVDAVGAPEGWHFGSVTLSHGPHAVRMPVAFYQTAAVWSSLTFETQFDKDMVDFSLTTGQDADPFVVSTYGLVDPIVLPGGPLEQDPDQDPTTDFCGEGQECWPFEAVGGELWWVFQTSSAEINDVDLFLYYDANDDGEFTQDELIDSSTTPTADEEVEAVLPAAGNYLVQVQAWAGSGTYELSVHDVGVDDQDASVMMMDVPGSIEAGNTYEMMFGWDHEIEEGVEYLGLVTLGDGDNPLALGFEPVRITGDVEAISKMVDKDAGFVNDTLNYELTLSNTSAEARMAEVVDMVPSQVQVDPASVTGGATYSNGKIMWSGELAPAGNSVVIGDSDFPYGYFSLAGLGVAPISGVCTSCDEAAVNFTGDPVSYLGVEYETVCMVSNGYLVMGGCSSTDDIQYVPQVFPDVAVPNNVIAPLWMDLDLDGGDGVGGGTWYAAGLTDGVNDWRVYEWEDAQRWGEDGTAFTFQVWLQEGEEAVTLTYGRLDGPFTDSTVGAENADASAGANYYNNMGGSEDGMQPTLDSILDVSGEAGASTHTITYSARAVATGEAENMAMLTAGEAMDNASATTVISIPPNPEVMRSRRFDVGMDSYLNGTQPSQVNGSSSTLWAGFDDNLRPIVKADFPICDDVYTCIPSNSEIDTAYLYLYVTEGRAFNNWVQSVMYMSAHQVLSMWDEASATWVSPWASPGGDVGPALDTLQVGSARVGTWLRFDVTEAVAAMVNDGAPNYGFVLASDPDFQFMSSPQARLDARFGLAAQEYWDPGKVGYLRIMYRTFTAQ